MFKRIITQILCLFGLLLYNAKVVAGPLLVDRLIVEVSGKSYSQRQLEVYGLMRTIAMGEPARLGLPAADRWSEQVESFKNEMIILTQLENDQTKLDSFLPEAIRLASGLKAVNAAQAKDATVDEFIRARSLTEAEIEKSLTMIFRVEGYTRSRLQLSQTRSLDDQVPSFIRLDPNVEWFRSLQKATAYRFYAQAKDYKSLAPLR